MPRIASYWGKRNGQSHPAQIFVGLALDLFLRKKLNIQGNLNVEEIMVYCPECETDLDIDEEEVDEGAVVSCPECGTDFEVITINPVELKIVGEDEVEDDDEEEADDEEDEDED